MSRDDNNDWFDVLTGKKEPGNREEMIFSELRQRVLKDAENDEFQLSEIDLQRGKKALRSAIKPPNRQPVRPFLSGLAAGIVAAGFGMSIFLTQFGQPDTSVTKGLPGGLTPSITREWQSPESLARSIPRLIEILSAEGIAFELESDGSELVLSFKTPAPLPEGVAAWLDSNGLESLPATSYQLTVTTKTAR